MASTQSTDPQVIPLDLGGRRVLMVTRPSSISQVGFDDDEQEVSGRKPRLDRVIDGLSAFAEQIVNKFDTADASRVALTFGCDVVMESGNLVALVGQASATASFTIELEWTRAD